MVHCEHSTRKLIASEPIAGKFYHKKKVVAGKLDTRWEAHLGSQFNFPYPSYRKRAKPSLHNDGRGKWRSNSPIVEDKRNTHDSSIKMRSYYIREELGTFRLILLCHSRCMFSSLFSAIIM